MKFLAAAFVALVLAGPAAATVSPYAIATFETDSTNSSCFGPGWYNYSGVRSGYGKSGFQTGTPANPISQTVTLQPMSGGVTGTNDHVAGYYSFGPRRSEVNDWLQAGVLVGRVPPDGFNQGGSQYFSGWMAYVEFNLDSQGLYYFHAYPAQATNTLTIQQVNTSADTFNVYINGSLVANSVIIHSGTSGRQLSAAFEDLNNDTPCDNGDFYYHTVTSGTISRMSIIKQQLPSLAVCNGSLSFEAWNRQYHQTELHGPPAFEVWSCPL